MSIHSMLFNFNASKADRKRDAAIALPEGVTECRNISYGAEGKWHLLDVCYPDGTDKPLPTIVSIHGGGYVYGSKEIYRRYAMDMARRGFAFVNFNYRLAPKWKFPAPLHDTNAVMHWIVKNAHRYHLDPQRIILVGDSAGAQLTSQYAAIWANPGYRDLFGMDMPKIKICCLGLNCGMYDAKLFAAGPRKSISRDYLGKKLSAQDPRFFVLEAIRENYPPAFITTACHDFLRPEAEPMYRFLRQKNIPAQYKCYGSEEDPTVGHVFHVNILLPEAIRCNDDSAEYFRKWV